MCFIPLLRYDKIKVYYDNVIDLNHLLFIQTSSNFSTNSFKSTYLYFFFYFIAKNWLHCPINRIDLNTCIKKICYSHFQTVHTFRDYLNSFTQSPVVQYIWCHLLHKLRKIVDNCSICQKTRQIFISMNFFQSQSVSKIIFY